ncbi:hypothetical protein Enr13x_67460 [Stieleria neptunia]|uniref:Uncharacterized protein n=1 Tax=Stieleria neptunia TaxID=2527979 RepID=A0A518I1C9_9BACT|nr:hypothetical protein Enr13x_67460 [Stieleria neptunia]
MLAGGVSHRYRKNGFAEAWKAGTMWLRVHSKPGYCVDPLGLGRAFESTPGGSRHRQTLYRPSGPESRPRTQHRGTRARTRINRRRFVFLGRVDRAPVER